ncbi:Hypothetical protein FKW44_019014 [Caligus rogercresseyi]|uniref:Uncharacterized protein n=1 Tax=Caligus rogercresseyi TaxID=217165 RepID=A0A7T8GV89_CALRO|nr:Hypothetical protein FKW44_019014 [Caligus rogercresseyi]
MDKYGEMDGGFDSVPFSATLEGDADASFAKVFKTIMSGGLSSGLSQRKNFP